MLGLVGLQTKRIHFFLWPRYYGNLQRAREKLIQQVKIAHLFLHVISKLFHFII